MPEKFIHLFVRSNYSLLYGTIPIPELVARAAAEGSRALALTDINNLYGVHEFIEACRNAGIRPIIGAEVQHQGSRAVVLVKDRRGFSHLCGLLTTVKGDDERKLSHLLQNYHGGTVILTDDERLLGELTDKTSPEGTGPPDEEISLYGMVLPWSQRIVPAARRLNLPLAAAGEVTLAGEDDFLTHRVLRAIAGQSALSAVPAESCVDPRAVYFPPDNAFEKFYGFEEAITATEEIARACTFDHIFEGYIFPDYQGGDGYDPSIFLRERAYAGAEVRYGELSESVLDRIEYELNIIKEKSFDAYFLVVADIVSRTERTCGRGSGAASIVAYCLGITNVDPIRHNLYFERFLNPDRIDPPDIDVDFAWDERDAIIDETMEHFGRDRCAMVATHIHFKSAGALRDVARVYGIPDAEISSFERAFDQSAGESPDVMDETWREIITVAGRIRGYPKHLSVHVGGLIITPEPLHHYVPVERAPKGVPVIAWDKDGAEAAGLVKIDLLGNRSLAVIRDALADIRSEGIEVDFFKTDPLTDNETIKLLARGDSMGVFYVESPAMRQLQKKTRAGDFEHLVIHSSIIRPAANRFINRYVDRLGGETWDPLHPRLDHILRETYGIMVYQEDVSKAAIALADFSPAEADGLRKILTKKNKEEKLAAFRLQFYHGAARNGVSEETCDRIWEMICSFDGYSFCKPHSASYAMVSFQSAYLKAHYPAHFMAAVISNGGGYYTPGAYISEARRMGLTVLPPDINESRFSYHGFGKNLRTGFMAVGSLRTTSVTAILKERNSQGPFTSMENLLHRTNMGSADLELLISIGACDSIAGERNRAQLLWTALMTGSESGDTAPSLFEPETTPPPARDMSHHEKMRLLYRSIGFLCDRHPLFFWQQNTSRLEQIRAADLPRFIGRDISITGWPVTQKAILTGTGQPMIFVSFEDDTDIFETVFFPAAYRRWAHLLTADSPFLIRGKVQDDRGAVNLHVQSIQSLGEGPESPAQSSRNPMVPGNLPGQGKQYC